MQPDCMATNLKVTKLNKISAYYIAQLMVLAQRSQGRVYSHYIIVKINSWQKHSAYAGHTVCG